MMRNRLKAVWNEGGAAVNGWLSIASSFTAEIMADQGYDSVTVDLQHGAVDYADCLRMFQAMRASGAVPMARVPWNDPAAIMRVLDAGAYGVICPLVNSRAEAERLVSAVRYPPRGIRSYGPTRAVFACGPDYATEADGEIVAFAMIETAEAFKNLDEIVRTPGLDGVYVGPADLTLGLAGGRLPPGFDRQEPDMIDAIRRILDTAKASGIRAGLHCGSPDYAGQAIGWGFDLVTVSSDVRLLAGAAAASVRRTREAAGLARDEAVATAAGSY